MKFLWHYILVSFRNLKSNRQTTLITLCGLVTSITVSYLIFGYNAYERSHDAFHDKKDQLFRIQNNVISKESGETLTRRAITFYAVQGLIENEIPEVNNSTQLYPEEGTLNYNQQSFKPDHAAFTTSSFFEMFSFPLVLGKKEDLNKPGTIFLSRSTAEKLFSNEDPLGKRVEFIGEGSGITFDLEVRGVFEDFPKNSYFDWKVLLPKEEFIQFNTPHLFFNPSFTLEQVQWRWSNFYTFIELAEGADAWQVEEKVQSFYKKYRASFDQQSGRIQVPVLENIAEMHLNPDTDAELTPAGNRKIIYLFYFVGILILFIAWINYMNITTANAMNRAREIGVRKAMGAFKSQIIAQLITEYVIINLISMVISIGLIAAISSSYEQFLGKEIFVVVHRSPQFWLMIIGLLMVGIISSGTYPALMLASFKPEKVLRASFKHSSGGNLLRRALITFQFVIVCGLISMLIIVYSQVNFMIHSDKGFAIDQKMIIDLPTSPFQEEDYYEKVNSFQQTLVSTPQIKSMSNSTVIPGMFNDWRVTSTLEGAEDQESVFISRMVVSSGFIKDYDLNLIYGRTFDENLQSDYEQKALLNQQGMRSLGIDSPEDIIGKTVTLFGSEDVEIIGVIEDFQQEGMHSVIPPIIMQMDSIHTGRYMTLTLNDDIQTAINSAKEAYADFFPQFPFSYTFLDESFERQYESDFRFQTIFSIFTGLAILLAITGLFSLSAFFANQRKKEVSIRKVLGASSRGITQLLLREYLKLVLIAGIVSIPLSYYITLKWLESFAYQIPLHPGVFLLPILFIGILVLLTVTRKTMLLANSNPMDNLRGD